MEKLYSRIGKDWVLASSMLARMNGAVARPITRQLFYSTITRLLAQEGHTHHDGRYLFVQADQVDLWVRYAVVREQKLATGEWIKRRPWSLADLALANEGVETEPADAPAEMAVAQG